MQQENAIKFDLGIREPPLTLFLPHQIAHHLIPGLLYKRGLIPLVFADSAGIEARLLI